MGKKQVDKRHAHTHLNSLDSEVTYMFHWLITCHMAILSNKNLICIQEEENTVTAEASQSPTQKPIGNYLHIKCEGLIGDTRVTKVMNLDFRASG